MSRPRCVEWHSVGAANRGTMGRFAGPVSVVVDLPQAFPGMDQGQCFWRNTGCVEARFSDPRRHPRHRVVHRRNLCSGKKRGLEVGKSRAGKTTKLMALADSNGFPLAIAIADGSKHDISLTDRTLDAAFLDELPPKLVGDKAWDSGKLKARLEEERNVELIAPVRGGKRPGKRKQDGRKMRRYQRRWVVERLFAWLKQFRRVATRWDRYAENYFGFAQLACVVILMRSF